MDVFPTWFDFPIFVVRLCKARMKNGDLYVNCCCCCLDRFSFVVILKAVAASENIFNYFGASFHIQDERTAFAMFQMSM